MLRLLTASHRLSRPTPSLEDLLTDDVTLAVMQADHIEPTETRQLFAALGAQTACGKPN